MAEGGAGQEHGPPAGAAQTYHAGVAHERGRFPGLGLNWSNKPKLFKE